jgi:Fic family protein
MPAVSEADEVCLKWDFIHAPNLAIYLVKNHNFLYEIKYHKISRIMTKIIQRYDAPHQFEPLMPSEHVLGPLLERAGDLARAASALGAAAGTGAQSELLGLLRAMNSSYTNRLDGEHTRPSDIDRAMHQDFSKTPDLARRQRLALAHIRTEQICEAEVDRRLATGEDRPALFRWLYSTEALLWIHRELFSHLKGADLILSDGKTAMQPGALRRRGVAIGIHEAPYWKALPDFIGRWGEVYGGARRGEAAIVALAAAHHRLAWMHPFLDGNGRVARLHTHLLLYTAGLTHGLWSPLRGFARTENLYRQKLFSADEHRRGDLDGRGNLTQAGLVDWIGYTLDVCIDQVGFMTRLLNIGQMRERILAALSFEEAQNTGVRREALNALHYLFATQLELGRADFKAMLGLGERTATSTLSALVRRGFVMTDSAYGALRFAIPRHALRFYFPSLWPEAEQELLRACE